MIIMAQILSFNNTWFNIYMVTDGHPAVCVCKVEVKVVDDFCHSLTVWSGQWGAVTGSCKTGGNDSFSGWCLSELPADCTPSICPIRLSHWLLRLSSLLWLVQLPAAFAAHVCCMRAGDRLFFFLHLLVFAHSSSHYGNIEICFLRKECVDVLLMVWEYLWKGFKEFN